jgi:NAD(P)-dependent dehydrogenase (short-subunit alcohol dehydrogenase family)
MASILITGANRGIGLELCRQLKERGDDVIAVCRSPSPDLEQLGVEIIEHIDVASDDNVEQLRYALEGRQIDVLINNAGMLRPDDIDTVQYDDMVKLFEVNTLGPLRVTRALLENLQEGSKVAIVSSRVGSVGDNGSGNNYAYRVSKAAVNMVGKNLSHDLQPRGIPVALLHPGMVATDMTGGRGIAPEKAAAGLIQRIDELNLENTGSFWHAEGEELPW